MLLALFAAALAASASVGAPSESTVITADVASVTHLNVDACTGSALSFGAIAAGDSSVTDTCVVAFGTNDPVAQLRMSQVDRRGPAMYQPATGADDETFGSSGLFSLNPTAGHDVFWSAAERADGTILLAGSTGHAGDRQTMIVRLNPDGTQIGSTTVVNLNVGGDDVVWSLEPLEDGSVLAGVNRDPSEIAVVRILANGTIDGGWAGTGELRFSFIGTPRGLKADGRGNVYVGGTHFWPPPTHCFAARFSEAGVLDTSYGDGGLASAGESEGFTCDGFDLDSRGRVVLAGTNFGNAMIVRLTEDGEVDPTFNDGWASFQTSGATMTQLVETLVLPDDTILVGGVDTFGTIMMRLDANGDLVTGFGTNGLLRLTGQNWTVRDFAWMDGRFYVASDYGSARVLRFNADGTPDEAFGTLGQRTFTAPGTLEDSGLVLLGDGRVLLHGASAPNGDSTAQARMLSAPSIPDYGAAAGDEWGGTGGFFATCLDSIGSNVTAVWTPEAGCPTSDAGWWRGVDHVPSTIATTPGGLPTLSEVSLRFGLRVPDGQPLGTYVAPIRFTVIAP